MLKKQLEKQAKKEAARAAALAKVGPYGANTGEYIDTVKARFDITKTI